MFPYLSVLVYDGVLQTKCRILHLMIHIEFLHIVFVIA